MQIAYITFYVAVVGYIQLVVVSASTVKVLNGKVLNNLYEKYVKSELY